MIEDLSDPRRQEPPYLLDERAMLEAWLEFHRTTLQLKCEGLDDAARKRRPIPSSILSLHGLIGHMAEVEGGWFGRTLQRDRAIPYLWGEDEDMDFAPVDTADWEADLAVWEAECEASRSAAAGLPLNHLGSRHGE